MPFWEERCIDEKYGGYLTYFDREGNLTDDTKYVWFQTRMLAIFSYMYHYIDHNEKWLKKAEHGVRFMLDKCYAGDGRRNYKQDRAGDVIQGTISIYSDDLGITSLADYLDATGCRDQQVLDVVKRTYEVYEQHMYDPDFKEIYENIWSQVFTFNDLYLASLNVVIVRRLCFRRRLFVLCSSCRWAKSCMNLHRTSISCCLKQLGRMVK